MTTSSVDTMDMINKNFYSFWLNDRAHSILSGGRSSMKSSVISLRLVIDFLQDDNGNVVCLRKVGKYLSTSVYEQIKWAIYMLEVEDEFSFGKSPLVIMHKPTGTGFYFAGVDDPMKLKGMNVAVGYYMALWFEELSEFEGVEDIDVVEDTFIRQELGSGKEVKVYYSYNPPRNPYSWVNTWKDSKSYDEEYFVHHSTYLEDEKGFLSNQMVRKIEKYKENDLDYWRFMYNGEVIGMGDNVYNINLFNPLDELPSDDPIMLIDTASDTGHQISATVHLAFGFTAKGNVILLDTYYYSPEGRVKKKAPSELSQEFKEWMDDVKKIYNKPIDMMTIDSAEGALRNQVFLDHGLRLHPVAKQTKVAMIDNVHDLLAQGRFYYLDILNNQIFIEEHKKFAWDQDSLRTSKPKVLEVEDHTCDSLIYYAMDNARKLGLKR